MKENETLARRSASLNLRAFVEKWVAHGSIPPFVYEYATKAIDSFVFERVNNLDYRCRGRGMRHKDPPIY